MSKLREAAQQALEALEYGPDVDPIFAGETEDALRAALAQQPEPSGYCTLEQLVVMQRTVPSPDKIAIYTAPPKADSAQEQPEPAQKPAAWRHKGAGHFAVTPLVSKSQEWEPLYTTPPQRPRLTDAEIAEATAGVLGLPHEIKVELARAIERKVRGETE